MKRIIIILLTILVCRTAPGEESHHSSYSRTGRFVYGVEWGISGNLFNYNVTTFITDVQSLVQIRSIDPFFHVNGEILADAGVNIGKRFNLSLAAGYAGIQKNMRFFPAELRGQVFLRPWQTEGSYFQIGGGGGLAENKQHRSAFFGRIGYGYRIYLGNGVSIDLKTAVMLAYSHPDAYDKYTGKVVPQVNLRQSDSMSLNTLLCIALIF